MHTLPGSMTPRARPSTSTSQLPDTTKNSDEPGVPCVMIVAPGAKDRGFMTARTARLSSMDSDCVCVCDYVCVCMYVCMYVWLTLFHGQRLRVCV